MKYVVFISIDEPDNWFTWHSGPTDTVYHSDFLDTKEEDLESNTRWLMK